jgi:hypothetical protein
MPSWPIGLIKPQDALTEMVSRPYIGMPFSPRLFGDYGASEISHSPESEPVWRHHGLVRKVWEIVPSLR